MPTVAMTTLGCAKNLVDAENMLGLLRQAGFTVGAAADEADVIIVNTCGFLQSAAEESLEAIREMARLKKEGGPRALVVAGCLAQRERGAIIERIPAVDAVVGTGDFGRIAEIAREALGRAEGAERAEARVVVVGRPRRQWTEEYPRELSAHGGSAYLKIAEGCDNACAFCTIPRLRGPQSSRPIESVVREARNLAAAGVRELVLVAQDTTAYGTDLSKDGRPLLAQLLRRLAGAEGVEGVEWIRLLYGYPSRFNDELIDTMAEIPKVVKYADIPLQHVSDRLLRLMGRPGDASAYRELLRRLRRRIPGVALRTTFIVGLPGETDAEFEELLEFVGSERLERVGAFTYSPEPETRAAASPDQVPSEIKEERYRRLMEKQQAISLAKNRKLIGVELPVLIEGFSAESRRVLMGRHQGQAPEVDGNVYVANRLVPAGTICRARVIKAYPYDLVAEAVGEDAS